MSSKAEAQDDATTPLSVEQIEQTLVAKKKDLEHAERQREQADAAMDVDVVVEAMSRADVLRKFIARLEGQLRDAREAEARRDAETRLLGIKRAHGSVAASLDNDEQRVREAVATLAAAVERMNARYAQVVRLHTEAAALVDRFGLGAPELPRVLPPALRGISVTPPVGLSDYLRPHAATEHDEHRLVARRTYREVEGTDGHAIIERAGLKPFPPLTERQQQVVAQRARDRAANARQLDPTLATAAAVTRALDKISGSFGMSGL